MLGLYERERILLKSPRLVRKFTRRRSASESHPRARLVHNVTRGSRSRNMNFSQRSGTGFTRERKQYRHLLRVPGNKVLKLEKIRMMLMETLQRILRTFVIPF
ncbi:hypothetical protein AVEN_107173-1 [Araneus ventricosus]|uniref:Uncharacterized protein n=1 Tax=Araneus ventricosus TaxID=182803 RepID=A0A4Y2FGV0_ARAVE|nr:hypothetical protein AVEN_107173-1 [Araneus ventricosus]